MRTASGRFPRRSVRCFGLATVAVVVVPLGAGVPSAAVGAAKGSAAHASAASPAAGAVKAQVPSLPASAIPEPRLRAVALRGVDSSVMRVAPQPQGNDHEHGKVGRSEVESTARPHGLKTAAAATVTAGTRPAELVAVSADEAFASGTSIQVRVQQPDGWTQWESLAAEDGHGPDPGSVEARGIRVGSEPLMAGDATKVQVRVDTPDGSLPAGTRLDLISAPTSTSDAESANVSAPASTSTRAAVSAVSSAAPAAQSAPGVTIPQPVIYTRAQWGANESWRSRSPYYTGDIRAGFLHHTASTSNYSRSETPAQIRAIYAYHTKSLGHSDIDYNFIVDRFGRLWEGRYGGMDRPVLGGHTAGFNENTFAVVALGNFQTTAPSSANLTRIKDSVARLFAWKLGLYGVNPVSTAHLLSVGYTKPTRYAKGTVAAIPAISSHRMVNYTSCPGDYLQRQLPSIRALAAKYAHVVIKPPVAQPSSARYGSSTSVAVRATTDRAVTWRADILSPCSTKPVRSYSGRASKAGPIAFTWDLRNTAGTRLLPAGYTVHLTGTATDGSPVLPVSGTVLITPAPGGSWGPCANVARVVGSSASATAVIWGRTFAPSSRTVVLTAPATESARALAAGVVAGPLARRLKAPLLLTPRTRLAGSVAADLRARKATKVFVVGGTSVVANAVVKEVAKLGASVTRLGGDTSAATALAVAQRFPATTPAILVSPSSAPAHALSGSALAATRGEPVLLAGETAISSATRKALAMRRSVTVAIPSLISDATVNAALPGVPWERLEGEDEVEASTVIGSATSKSLQHVMMLPAVPSTWGTASLASAVGTPLLFTGRSTLPTETGAFLQSRGRLRTGLTPLVRTVLDDSVLGATSQLLGGEPWAPKRPVTYQVTSINAAPEPVKKGATLSLDARIKVSYDSITWRDAPVGTSVAIQHRPEGAAAYRAVTTVRLTEAGWLHSSVVATKTGHWRIVVGGTASKFDHVLVIS
jgi:hypothetical protein